MRPTWLFLLALIFYSSWTNFREFNFRGASLVTDENLSLTKISPSRARSRASGNVYKDEYGTTWIRCTKKLPQYYARGVCVCVITRSFITII